MSLDVPINPDLLPSDHVVLQNLLRDIRIGTSSKPSSGAETAINGTIKRGVDYDDETTFEELQKLQHVPTVVNTWNTKELPLSNGIVGSLLSAYISWAKTIVRNPVDVVFLTHIILYLCTSVPSAIYLYCHFNIFHGVFHWLMQLHYCGAFTLMLHNHIHNNGLLKKKYAWFDQTWPYILEPLMGHTWDSYYYHHVKHHHVEGNGPEDLSSTIRYQRDELTHFLMYVGRFLALIWLELPLYFIRKKKRAYAMRVLCLELTSYTLMYLLARWKFQPTLYVFVLPFIQMRIGLMIGNFGQHALVDDIDPLSDFRSSITLIDVPSNRHCFNDGWHTSHHLNPLRHWRDHPRAFLKAKHEYTDGKALVFRNIDYLMMTYRLLTKDYLYLADRLVPMGDQMNMSRQEIADMLRTKTRRFPEEEIRTKFYREKRA